MFKGILSIIIYYFLLNVTFSQNQQAANPCSQYLRNLRRRGSTVSGTLEIPVDEHFPKYKLKLGFNNRIHHMEVRQLHAKDTGTHRDFVVDAMEMQKDGKMQLDVYIRLRRAFGHAPRMTRIVYNNVALCGDLGNSSDSEDGTSFALSTSSPPRRTTIPILVPLNASLNVSKDKDYADEEEDFFE